MTRDEMMTALKQAQDFFGNRAKMAGVGDGAMLLYSWVRALDMAWHRYMKARAWNLQRERS